MGATYVFARDAAEPEYDRSLAWAGLLLMAIGVVMVYSASIATAEASRYTGANAAFFLLRHALFLGGALATALVVFLLPVRFWQKAAPLGFLACLLLLVLVLVPGIGREVNGARRWLDLGAFTLQPSELAKLAVVLYAADGQQPTRIEIPAPYAPAQPAQPAYLDLEATWEDAEWQ